MKIAYVAKHGSGGNDDEGAVTYALTALGHEVLPVWEGACVSAADVPKADLLLFHKWDRPDVLRELEGRMTRAFWYWDLVDWPADPTLARRCAQRRAWMERIVPLVDVGFLTDGDWVANDRSGKLRWLPQGADERVAGAAEGRRQDIDILFCGIGRGGGLQREEFVRCMRAWWGKRFHHVEWGVHGRRLAELVGRAKVVVAPDSPVTDRYCSNRAWLMLGFGAFLLHPACACLERMLDGGEATFYGERTDLMGLLERFLSDGQALARGLQGVNAVRTISAKHLYRHRCDALIKSVEEVCRG